MQPDNQTISRIILERRSALAEAVVARQYLEQGDVWNRYGTIGRKKSLQDAEWHLTYLTASLDANDPSLFVDYVAWLKVLFAGLSFPDTALVHTLQWTRDVLHENLPQHFWPVADAYLTAAETNLPRVDPAPTSYLVGDTRLTQLARNYLDALLRGDRWSASRAILDTVARGTSVQDIYLHIFQPVQQEIGRLWQTNQISVAQEHFCTAATQLVMSQLYPYIFKNEKGRRRLVATCIQGELHETGVRMVSDFLEMGGWDTYYIGANMPFEGVLRALRERDAHMLAVSATMTFHVRAVRELIAAVRATAGGNRLPILVGGRPFNLAPLLWRDIGADGFAQDAQEAIEVAARLVDPC